MMDARRTVLSAPYRPDDMRYIRAYLGGDDDSPALILYEIDPAGIAHRHVEVTLDGARFLPEDVLLLGPLDVDALVGFTAAEEVDREAFEALWGEVETSRRFRTWLPDPAESYSGHLVHEGRRHELRWEPHHVPAQDGWSKVPGFAQLYVVGDDDEARAIQHALFFGAICEWSSSLSGAWPVDFQEASWL